MCSILHKETMQSCRRTSRTRAERCQACAPMGCRRLPALVQTGPELRRYLVLVWRVRRWSLAGFALRRRQQHMGFGSAARRRVQGAPTSRHLAHVVK
jgi:hypothetical protein